MTSSTVPVRYSAATGLVSCISIASSAATPAGMIPRGLATLRNSFSRTESSGQGRREEHCEGPDDGGNADRDDESLDPDRREPLRFGEQRKDDQHERDDEDGEVLPERRDVLLVRQVGVPQHDPGGRDRRGARGI
jgi:hypothetical protein